MPDTFSRDLIGLLPNLRRFAISLCRSSDIADDLVQLTCQKALISRDGFTPGTRMDAWLFRILRNSWIDLVRKRKNEGQPVDIDDAYDLPGQAGAEDADTRLMLAQTLETIHALPDEQREVLLLVCVEELSYKETADILDIPIGTVMSRLARARKHIGEQLGINRDPPRSNKGKG
ncbi:MAG: RNA polymerase sigma factor [Alphaproteobacteria bacterium]|nr:RNA polymerase sigma factor [Alphaproteobacteria bacterium]